MTDRYTIEYSWNNPDHWYVYGTPEDPLLFSSAKSARAYAKPHYGYGPLHFRITNLGTGEQEYFDLEPDYKTIPNQFKKMMGLPIDKTE